MATINQRDDDTAGKKKQKQHATEPSGPVAEVTSYLKGVKTEWTKVSWPTWPQIWGQTIVVLVMVIAVTTGLFIADKTFSLAIQFLLQVVPTQH